MPYLKGKLATPDELINAGRCPETGIPLEGVHIEHHIARTWTARPNLDASGDEPRRRMKMLRDWAKQNQHLHPKYDDNGNLIVEDK